MASEKGISPVVLDPPPLVSPSAPASSSFLSSVTSPFTGVANRFSSWKSQFGLSNPGTVENLQKEVKQTHLNQMMFDGFKANLTKGLSMEPGFQVTHQFAMGSQNAPPSYNFSAVFAKSNGLLMHGAMNDDGSFGGQLNKSWSPQNKSTIQTSLSPGSGSQNMLVAEHEYIGSDYSIGLRAMNPSLTDGTGVYIGNYLQSLTKNLSIGFESIYQRPAPGIGEVTPSYLMKYVGDRKDWIATAQLQPTGILQATYWHKISDKVEFAADLQLLAVPQRREAITTLGAKYDLRMATVRAQVDSTGKVSTFVEQRLSPALALLFTGEIDHTKAAAKVGVGVSIETSSLSPEEMGYPPQQSHP